MFLICSLRLRLLILTVAFFILSLSGFAKDYGDAIIVASIADARTLVPILASDSASSGLVGMVFNGLVKYDKDINITGDLAKSWEIKEGGLVIIFHLRDNVRWHDGHKFTAEDVEFTYKSLVDPKVRTPYSGDFERIASLKAIDDYTLEVRYKEPFAPALSSWGMPVMPRHLLEGKDLNTG
ncbi:MAG: ABC transporter substrate-binding protein, partial [Candidatus Omnitrophica bacterium]|nr:ABC transporter substrate-binding protein [Candidatus Omnitrophota bacterium]